MPKHYLYRMDHDTGFAPHIWRGVCTLCGCKRTTVERDAEPGSWVVGIGGNKTGQPDKLIYAMRVNETPTFSKFRRDHPANASYLKKTPARAPVLVARGAFWYFGDQAVELPPELRHIVLPGIGRKRLTDEDVERLKAMVLDRFPTGRHGKPNNPEPKAAATCMPRRSRRRGPC